MSMDTLFPLNFSHSVMSDIWKCELYFFRAHCQKLVGSATNSDLIAGGHFAKACEIVRSAYFNEGLEEQEAMVLGTSYILTAEDTGDQLKSNERLAFHLSQYFKKFPLNGNVRPAKLVDGTHAIEYTFAFDTGIKHPELDRNIVYKGKLDAIIETTLRDGRVKRSIIDEKTCKSVYRLHGTKLIDLIKEEQAYRADGQLIGYSWAAKQLKLDVHEALIRRVPIMTTYEPPFELVIPITDFMIEQWSIATFNKIEELVDKYLYYKTHGGIPQESFYPTYHTHACQSYNRACQYIEGCLNTFGEDILETTHKQIVKSSDMEVGIPLDVFKKNLFDEENKKRMEKL